MRAQALALRDGRPVLVVRPRDTEQAAAIARAIAEGDAELVAVLADEVKAYTFVGWLHADRQHVVDHEGRSIDELKPGDLLTTDQETTQP